MDIQLPSYFEPRTTDIDHLRLPYNPHKWKYWHMITYEDLYQAYLSVGDFKARTRIPFDYDYDLRCHVVLKSFKKHHGHGQGDIITFSHMENHHTCTDYFISKTHEPLTLMYKESKIFERVDDYLTINRRWIDDRVIRPD